MRLARCIAQGYFKPVATSKEKPLAAAEAPVERKRSLARPEAEVAAKKACSAKLKGANEFFSDAKLNKPRGNFERDDDSISELSSIEDEEESVPWSFLA